MQSQLASANTQQVDPSVLNGLQQDNQSLKQTIHQLKKELDAASEKISTLENSNNDLKSDM